MFAIQIYPLASIPAFAMPEAEDQVQNLTFNSNSTIFPSSITSDSASRVCFLPCRHNLLVDSIHAAPTTSSSTSSDLCSRSESGLLLYCTASTSTISDPLVNKRPPRETILKVKLIPYTFNSFCEQCWEKYTREKRKREQEIERTLTSRKKKVHEMMKHVRGLNSTEQVPIGYAVEKLMGDTRSGSSQRWHQRDLISCLSQDLQIVKVRNRYMCNKQRVDAMDFKLWSFYRRPDIDV